MLTRLAIFAIWALQFFPRAVQASIGRDAGTLFYLISRRRRNVVMTNLRLCFPAMTEAERVALAKKHFKLLGRSLVERGMLWWGSEARLRSFVQVEGDEILSAEKGRPVILLAPHFIGLDMGWTRLTADHDMVTMYAAQNNPVFNQVLLEGRTRFGTSTCISRNDGIRGALRALQQGRSFYYLPDMDYGERDTIFVPFFGVPAATITGVSRIAKLTGAKVIPCISRMLPGSAGYVVKLYPPWENFPTDDIEADTRRMNAFIEERVLEMPEQYYWVHRRFKTRPAGAEKPY